MFSLEKENIYSVILNEVYTFSSRWDNKEDSVLFLIHLVGDLMQPLHVTQLVNEEFPKGDRGGVLYSLRGSKKKNLHMFADNLGNFLQSKEVSVHPLVKQSSNIRIEHLIVFTHSAFSRDCAVIVSKEKLVWIRYSERGDHQTCPELDRRVSLSRPYNLSGTHSLRFCEE